MAMPAIARLTPASRALFGSKQVPIPFIADSIKDVTVIQYLVKEGDVVQQDDEVMEVESHKGSTKIRTATGGKVLKLMLAPDTDVSIGTPFIEVDPDVTKGPEAPKKSGDSTPKQAASEVQKEVKAQPQSSPKEAPKERNEPKQTQRSEDRSSESQSKPSEDKSESKKKVQETPQQTQPAKRIGYVRTETREKMSRLRKTVAERLKESQNTNAHVTTIQEIDMSEIMKIRKELGEDFLQRNGVKLGFMSFFVKAVTRALQERPIVNSVIQGNEIVHRSYIDISVAVSSPKGLVVPVLRDCETLSFADVEKNLADLAKRAANGALAIEDMSGGTFTISNGGVFGSILSIPVINPPQSAVLGMHNIVNRPVVRGDQIVARPIMYISMSYDHRLLDGREGAGFLKRVQELLDDPRKLLLEA
jgi:2-oxoglutarate dehydrogenase E2 component (dihydrolipoamide succinyltransferase)